MDFPQDDIWAEKILLSLCRVKLNGGNRVGFCHGTGPAVEWTVCELRGVGGAESEPSVVRPAQPWAGPSKGQGSVGGLCLAAQPACSRAQGPSGKVAAMLSHTEQCCFAGTGCSGRARRQPSGPGQEERVWRHRGKGKGLAPEPGKPPGSASGQNTPWRGRGSTPQAPGSLSW